MALRRIRSRRQGQRQSDSEVRWVVGFLLSSFALLAVLGRANGDERSSKHLRGAFVPLENSTGLGELKTEPSDHAQLPSRSRTLRLRPDSSRGAIEIRKSSASYQYDFPSQFGSWTEIGKSNRSAILKPQVQFQRWQSIVLHASGTRLSDPQLLASYHETALGIDGGMAYHFLIGSDEAGGQRVSISPRWLAQQDAPRGQSSIHIALAGDFERTHVDEGQLRALHELVVLLQAQVGEIPVLLHRNADQRRPTCLGLHFPGELILNRLNTTTLPALHAENSDVPPSE